MTRTVILYGLIMCALIFLLKILEYRLWIRDLSIEHYIGMVAILFTALGVWAGRKLNRSGKDTAPAPVSDVDREELLRMRGISQREYEILQLIARGHSNQEIADKLFISLNTVKTHISNLLQKLDAKRRTQAIEHAKRDGLIG